jgi:predicted membrane protein
MLSTLLAVFLAVWTMDRYAADGTTMYALIGVMSIAAAIGLVVYGVAFRRKSRYW